jgi:hypothetical protein
MSPGHATARALLARQQQTRDAEEDALDADVAKQLREFMANGGCVSPAAVVVLTAGLTGWGAAPRCRENMDNEQLQTFIDMLERGGLGRSTGDRGGGGARAVHATATAATSASPSPSPSAPGTSTPTTHTVGQQHQQEGTSAAATASYTLSPTPTPTGNGTEDKKPEDHFSLSRFIGGWQAHAPVASPRRRDDTDAHGRRACTRVCAWA